LHDGCGNSSQPSQNAVAGYHAWTQAGFPANKIVLGLPGYGYVTNVGVNHLQQRSLETPRLHRLARRTTAQSDDDHQIQFRDLVSDGILQRNSDGNYDAVPASGFQRSWDECSATPFLHSSLQTIPYDDPESLAMKAEFARQTGMGGVNLFDIHGDTDQMDLVTAIRNNLFGSAPLSTTSPSRSPTSVSIPADQPGVVGALSPGL